MLSYKSNDVIICASGEFHFSTFTANKISDFLRTMKSSTSGYDGVNMNMINFFCPVIISYFTHIINSVLLESYFPGVRKDALIIIPIAKQICGKVIRT